ncbi:MAG: hypothetical protein IPN39_04320 [Chitinophagaceae bacterium]|nr:hypothetical protein [Chitinophagaceae bacterium]
MLKIPATDNTIKIGNPPFPRPLPPPTTPEITAPDTEYLIKLIDQKNSLCIPPKDDYLILDKPTDLEKGFTESTKYPLLYKDKNVLHRLE